MIAQNSPRHQAPPEPVPMLRWIFRRHTEMLTCEVDATAGDRWDVCVVPHWNVAGAVIERFDAPISALERHAEIARRLREAGWSVIDRVPVGEREAA
jgi:hypothetical protein